MENQVCNFFVILFDLQIEGVRQTILDERRPRKKRSSSLSAAKDLVTLFSVKTEKLPRTLSSGKVSAFFCCDDFFL